MAIIRHTFIFTYLWCGLHGIAAAHPTDGYICTSIETATICFNSNGFCEWFNDGCIYRCDLHETQDDCAQLKDGCTWNGDACQQPDSPLDSFPHDVSQTPRNDSLDGSTLNAPSIDAEYEMGDAQTKDEDEDIPLEPSAHISSCQQRTPTGFPWPILIAVTTIFRTKHAHCT